MRYHFGIAHDQIDSDGPTKVICTGVILSRPIKNLKVIFNKESEPTSRPTMRIIHVECIVQCLTICTKFEMIRDQIVPEFFITNITPSVPFQILST